MSLQLNPEVLFRGLVRDQAPNILRGILIRLLKDVNVKQAVEWVNQGHSLWAQTDEKHRLQIRTYAPKVGDWSWFTVDWLIDSLRNSYPGLASLFLGWDEGRAWLENQITEFKKEAGI